MRPLKENAIDTRREILKAAERKFGENGFSGTSVNDIVKETSITKPMVYYHFKSKDGLYLALLQEAHGEVRNVISTATKSGDSIRDKMISVYQAVFAFVKKRPELIRLVFSAEVASPAEFPYKDELNELRRELFALFENLIKEGIKSGELASEAGVRNLTLAIFGQLSYLGRAHLTTPEVKLTPALATASIDLFLNGAAPRNS